MFKKITFKNNYLKVKEYSTLWWKLENLGKYVFEHCLKIRENDVSEPDIICDSLLLWTKGSHA